MVWGSAILQAPLGAGRGLTRIGLRVDIDPADGLAIIVHSKDQVHLFGIVCLRAAEPVPGTPNPEAQTQALASGPAL